MDYTYKKELDEQRKNLMEALSQIMDTDTTPEAEIIIKKKESEKEVVSPKSKMSSNSQVSLGTNMTAKSIV